MMSAEQTSKLGLNGPGKGDITSAYAKYAGPSCTWSGEKMSSLGVAFLLGNKNGLSDMYRGNNAGFYPYFEPTTVDGYPAVMADRVDNRASGFCQVAVGLNDKLMFTAKIINGSNGRQSCADAKSAAAEVLRTVKGND